MTRDEFLNLQHSDSAAPLIIEIDDGRVGLCSHWTQEAVLADLYRDNQGQQWSVATEVLGCHPPRPELLRIPFAAITHAGGCILRAPASAVLPL